MNRFILLLAFAVGLAALHKFQNQRDASFRQEYARGIAANEDNCAGKKFCALVYLAPWCGACKMETPRIRSQLARAKNLKDYGMKVVVGQGRSPGDNEQMASLFGAGASVDNTGALLQKFAVNRFPSFFVLDQEGSVILRDQEAFQWVQEKF